MKIYLPNNSRPQVGGGWSFIRTFIKYAGRHGAQIVNTWEECDVVLIPGVTLVDVGEIKAARAAGKPILFRVGNVPRKSRNRRSTPHERMKEIAELSDMVIHQSEWSRRYCFPLVGDGPVVYNGADTDVFFPAAKKPDQETWLFAYHGKNETKNFWTAYFLFQNRFRDNPNAKFIFIYDFGRDLGELHLNDEKDPHKRCVFHPGGKMECNQCFDFWNGEKYEHIQRAEDAEDMAEIMRQCTHYVHPAVADACPNTVLEARACGLEVIGAAPAELAGTIELLDPNLDVSADRMAQEYVGLCKLALGTP